MPRDPRRRSAHAANEAEEVRPEGKRTRARAKSFAWWKRWARRMSRRRKHRNREDHP